MERRFLGIFCSKLNKKHGMSFATAASQKSVWGFSPQSIPGLALWLDAADTTSITGTSTVTAWRDKSGNGNNATATGSPALTPNAINGVQAISTAVGTYFRGSVPISGSTLTCFAVATTNVTLPNLRNPRRDQRLVSLANGTNPDYASNGLIALFNQDNTSTIAAFDYPNFLGRPSNPIVKDIPFLAVTHFNGTTASLWFNGSAGTVPKSAYSTSFSITKYGIGEQAGVVSPNNENWSGFFGEIILFNTALTTSERQQVEGYLAAKWGLGMNLPTTHPYSSVIPILPTQIPGCRLWLDAADPAGTGIQPANGSTITQWVDKSGLGNNGTPNIVITWAASGLGVNLPAMSFTGRQWFTGNISITGNQFTAFIVLNMSSSSEQYPRILSLGAPGANAYANPLYIAMLVFDKSVYRFTNYRNNIYPPSGGNITYGIPQLTSSWVDGTNSFVAINGRTPASVGSSGDFGVSSYAIGTDTNTGDATTQFSGFISEIIVFNIALSTTQRQQMEQYLGQKWGIGVTNTTVAPGRYLIPFNRPFYPTDIGGCTLWLDGADRSSMVFSGTTVTTWRDKSGTGNNFTGSATYALSSFNNKFGLAFDGTNNYFNQASGSVFSITNTTYCIFTVHHFTTNGGPERTVYRTAVPNPGAFFRQISGAVQWITDLDPAGYITRTATGESNSGINCINAITTTSVTAYLNGTSVGSSSKGSSTNMTFMVGQGTSGGIERLLGTIFEMIIFNNTLTTAQQQQVEQYLAWKWGLVANLPPATSHLGKLLPAFSTNFTPKSLTGLRLWLDAADASTVTGTTSVTAWMDKSGTGNNMSLTSAGISYASNTITVAGGAIMTSAVTTAITAGQSFAFIVCQPTYVNAFGNVLRFPGINSNYTVRFTTTTGLANYDSLSDFGFSSGYYVNGNLFAGGTGVVITIPAQTNIIGGASTLSGSSVFQLSHVGSRYFYGTIQEVIFYTGPISTQQRQQVEGYLAWKWGLQSSLPSTHAYAKFSP